MPDRPRPHASPRSTPFPWVHGWCGFDCPWHGHGLKSLRVSLLLLPRVPKGTAEMMRMAEERP